MAIITEYHILSNKNIIIFFIWVKFDCWVNTL